MKLDIKEAFENLDKEIQRQQTQRKQTQRKQKEPTEKQILKKLEFGKYYNGN